MTSEVDSSQTNEFLRRRKLRFQQVREQSKDIAKKIRQRAKVEKLRQVVELDSKKQKEYLHRQESLVKRLEEYYAQGIQNVGLSHKKADALTEDDQGDKVDLSKKRGKEATAELRKKRQQLLDERKKLLDRKLLAREAANEFSREKSATVINKFQSKPGNKGTEDIPSKPSVTSSEKDCKTKQANEKDTDVARNDMATQWDLEEMPNDWETNIPTLALPEDENSVKESNNNIVDSKSDKSKRLDLFALSDEMPTSLRGGLTNQEERVPTKSSLTLVSEYLQNRGLRLRESNTAHSSKKMEDLQSLKQTIQRTRASKEAKGNIDRGSIPSTESTVPKKSSVTMYNHSTRDSRDVPYNVETLVVRESQADDDAYSQAMKESTTSQHVEKDHNKKIQEIRSKVAMTKQNVEKEYKDTISFLNALPKDKGNKPIKTAFMDEQRQQMKKDSQQQKLQQEYRKIEKECTKPSCRNKIHRKSRSPNKDRFESTDFQYSWMPVPEGDGNFAVHTIPTTLKDGKSGNTVKFSKVDSYHEYRSRHKHTPPTKDTTQEKPRNVEAVIIQNDSSDTESVSSDSSSLRLEKKDKTENDTANLSDAERIIIYKILDSKVDKKTKTSKLIQDIAKSLTLIQKQNSKTDRNDRSNKNNSRYTGKTVSAENRVSFEQLNEGVYKTVNENGDNVASMYFHDREGEIPEIDELRQGRPCTSNKINKEDQEFIKTATQRHPERGDIPPSNTPRSRSSCTTDCNNVQTTSTSSFTTKNTEKANALPDSDFIKLVDNGGQESGKFYIGASGFLKDDAYEVVIQLRKKGDDKESSTEKTEDTKKKNQQGPLDKVSVVTVAESTTEKSSDEMHDTNKIPSVTSVSTVSDVPQDMDKMEHPKVRVINVPEDQVDPSSKPIVIESTDKVFSNEPKNVCEKGVSTSFQDTCSIPTSISKPDPLPRPATSIYTQTSMSSPNHRPVFFHMSSSTSTAYMSPPDMILPKFMRHDQLTDEEMYDPRNFEMDDVEDVGRHEYSDEHDCKCRKCMHARKVTMRKQLHALCRKACSQDASTPPNTARSSHSHDEDREHSNSNKKHTKHDKHLDTNKKPKCECRKCKRDEDNNLVGFKKPRHIAAKKSSRNFSLRGTPSAASSNKDTKPASIRNKTALKPVIKNYVDKLLVLNRESLKAVQVIDQDCSSVTTPGSSIIEVPNNTNQKKPVLAEKLSLQQIQIMLQQKLVNNIDKKYHQSDGEISKHNSEMCLKTQNSKQRVPKMQRKKTAHKVKTLNISRNLSKPKKTCDVNKSQTKVESSSSSTKECTKKTVIRVPSRSNIRSKSSPTPRLPPQNSEYTETSGRSANSDLTHAKWSHLGQSCSKSSEAKTMRYNERKSKANLITASSNHDTQTSTSPDFNRINLSSMKRNDVENPMSISTQTSINVDSEINYMKLAEDKLQNMEKIADLTEKCTQRLSNLAKVLDEVRKNKSLAYSQISTSDTTSDSDQKSDKNRKIDITTNKSHELVNNVNKKSKSKSPKPTNTETLKENDSTLNSTGYIPFLSDIPKPVTFKNLNVDLGINSSSSSSRKSNSPAPVHENDDYSTNKNRGKPPPALSRHLKHVQDFVVPHELSTVVEVDSPLSVKLKSSRNDTKIDVPETSNRNTGTHKESRASSPIEIKKGEANYNPDLLDSNVGMSNQQLLISATGSSDNSKMQMIDIKQFNEIMLKPFYSIQEYAQQCNVVSGLDDGSNFEDILKDDHINDEMSSLHSEASLPDVISELLKRNIISEPFKFDTGSNANSTTVSSESTISVLALSKARQGKKRSGVMFKNKENIGETSDTLSISSNPDLENAFKKLGMGWASSTLKKTKERLALSSSSNTSSSSLSQFKVKSFNQDIPALVTDTVSSVLNTSKKTLQRNITNSSKNAQQQTSPSNSMTVKEFLTNELAKKITFNKSRNDTEEEFVSLFETKIPEEMKHSSRVIGEENSIDNSMRSGNNNRARTSTPVQLFKSMTYHSSSSSNISNGLFSNVDDLSSVKVTSNSMKHSTSDKDDLIIPNFSLRMKRGSSECSKSD